jgi:uridylate kinase
VAEPRYRRVVIKLSGEALAGGDDFDLTCEGLALSPGDEAKAPPGTPTGEGCFGIDPRVVYRIACELKECRKLGFELGIVVGGGNFLRARSNSLHSVERTTADYMGMLASVLNCLALQAALESLEVETRVLSAVEIREVAEPYIWRRAMRHLEKGRIVIFAGGTGNPYFTTDTAAALRAAEINADALLKATNVDGVYERDPKLYPDAARFDRLDYAEALRKGLGVMDATAISLSMDRKMPVIVFDLRKPGNIRRVLLGENIGSVIS